MTDGQPRRRAGRVRFTATADIERLLAGDPDVRAALLEDGIPATALSVTADAQLTVLDAGGRQYIRFATAGNGDPVAVELPSGRVVELVTRPRRHPPPETIVNVALYSTSVARFCQVWEAFHAREPFYSRADCQSREASGQIERLRTGLLADLERIDPGAATGLWADPACDIDMGDYPSDTTP
jgi:hypothetical protein